nr:MAG TPA: hypothetical protein [Bacteriophage sp.]
MGKLTDKVYKGLGYTGQAAAKFLNKTGLTNTQLKKIQGHLGIIATGATIAATGYGLAKGLSPWSKYIVVYKSSTGTPKHQTVLAESPMKAIDKVKRDAPNMTGARAFKKGEGDYDAQEYMSSIGNTNYSDYSELSDRIFSLKFSIPKRVQDAILISFGTALGISLLRNLKKSYMDYNMEKGHDRTLNEMNSELNRLTDNHKAGISAGSSTPDEYFDALSHLMSLVLKHSKYNKDEFGKSDILATVIYPFMTLLRSVLISGVHILAGDDTGADRSDFELVFAPDVRNPEELKADPTYKRNVIFSHKWPDHGFKTTTLGAEEANLLIDDTFRFLSKNPKFLSIRL